ncbi:MAG: hypothetical protein K2O17_02200 [Bacteroidaceae bacterium]|nr:hypothetical protein [Bacteroidaceae bacterium]
MRKLSDLQNLLFRLGALLMLAGAVSHLFYEVPATVVFLSGVLLFASMQLQMVYEGRNFIVARLRRQQLFGASMLVLSGASMTSQLFGYNATQHNEWVICLLVGALVELYTTLRISMELKKEKK